MLHSSNEQGYCVTQLAVRRDIVLHSGEQEYCVTQLAVSRNIVLHSSSEQGYFDTQ